MTDGGEGTKSFSRPQTLQERLKRQKSNKQFYINHPEALIKRSQITKQLWQNEEYRKKVTESHKKTYAEHPELRQRFCGENNPMYGKHHTEESIQKIKAAAANRKLKIAQLNKDTLEIIKVHDGVKDAEKALNVSHG